MNKNRLGQYLALSLGFAICADALARVVCGGGTTTVGGLGNSSGGSTSTQTCWWEPGDGMSAWGPQGQDTGQFVENPGDNDSIRDASEGDPPCSNGSNPSHANPIVLSTGNKIEKEVDFESSGIMPLKLERTYNANLNYVGLFGPQWGSNFNYTMVRVSNGMYVERPDGRRILFVWSSNPADPRAYENKADPIAYVLCDSGGCTHYTEDLLIERYSFEDDINNGRPTEIKNLQGIGWTFTYGPGVTPNNPKRLIRVTHTSGRSIQFSYTSFQVTQVTSPDNGIFTYAYDPYYRLTSVTAPSVTGGNESTRIDYHYENINLPYALTGKSYQGIRYSTFAYDSQGRATLSQHNISGGIVDKYIYSYTGTVIPLIDPPPPPLSLDPDEALGRTPEENAIRSSAIVNRVVVETNPLGRTATYRFDSEGRLTSASEAASANCSARANNRTYDANGYVDRVTDFNGNITDYDYNAKGQLIRKVEALNTSAARTTTYLWDPTYNRKTRETVVGDHQVDYVYNANHRLASVKITNLSPNGLTNNIHTWTYTYTLYTSGIVQTMVVDGPQTANDQVTYSYSSAGDLISIKNTRSHITSFASYNGLGQPGRVTGPNSDITDYAYFPGGKLKQVTTFPNGVASATRYTYGYGALFTMTTPDNITSWYAYDQARRLVRETRDELNGLADRRITYNAASDPTSVVIYRGDGATLRYRSYTDYDELSRVIARRGNNGQNVRYSYDSNGNLKKITDSLNRQTTFDYDPLNRLLQQTDAKQGVTRYEYDKGDRITKVIDPKLLATTYAYDGFGQIWRQASPDTGTTTYSYTASGFRNAMTRADMTETSYAYDDIGRLTAINAGGQTQAFGYDTCTGGKGRLCTVTDPTGTLAYTYTAEGRIARHRLDHATSHGGYQTWNYAYDLMGRPATIAGVESGVQQQFSYTTGQLSAVKVKIGTAVPINVATNFTYEPMGPFSGFTFGNGLVRRKTYDLDRRVTAITSTGTGIQNLSYAYNANDLVSTRTNSVDTAATQTYSYDELSRLTSVTAGMGNQGFTYDANGNRLTHTTSAGTASLTYFAGTNRLNTWARTGASTRYYNYDANGNPLTITGAAYTYDPFNRLKRVIKGGVTTSYEVNALGQRVFKSVGSTQYFYAYAPDDSLLGEFRYDGAGWRDYVRVEGELIGYVRAGALFFAHNDHLGRPEALSDVNDGRPWVARHGAFESSVLGDLLYDFNQGFPGQHYDNEAGTWYNLNRDYDGSTGRYLQPDPIGLTSGSTNLYAYVGGNPVGFTDHLGLDREIIFWSPMLHDWGSWLGHVSSRVGDNQSYSFGPGGWDKTYPTVDQYVRRQTQDNHRTGLSLVVTLNPAQDKKFDQCMAKNKEENSAYSILLNNCTTGAQMCLINSGVPLAPSITPGGFQEGLFDTGLVNDINWYHSGP